MIKEILLAANIYNISPSLLLAVCSVESDLRPGAINHNDGGRASYGICQVQLRTAKFINGPTHVSDLLNPELNSLIAAKYLRYQLDRYKDDQDCAVAAYNAGSCIKNEKGVYINERYVKKVKRRYRKYKTIYGDHQQSIYARNRADSLALLFRRHANDQTKDDVQSTASLVDQQGIEAPVRSGDRRQ